MLCRKIGSLALTRSWFLKWKIRKKTRKILINSKWDKKPTIYFTHVDCTRSQNMKCAWEIQNKCLRNWKTTRFFEILFHWISEISFFRERERETTRKEIVLFSWLKSTEWFLRIFSLFFPAFLRIKSIQFITLIDLYSVFCMANGQGQQFWKFSMATVIKHWMTRTKKTNLGFLFNFFPFHGKCETQKTAKSTYVESAVHWEHSAKFVQLKPNDWNELNLFYIFLTIFSAVVFL